MSPSKSPRIEDLQCRDQNHDWYVYDAKLERQDISDNYGNTAIRLKRRCTRCGSENSSRLINRNTGEILQAGSLEHSGPYRKLLDDGISRQEARMLFAKLEEKRIKAERAQQRQNVTPIRRKA